MSDLGWWAEDRQLNISLLKTFYTSYYVVSILTGKPSSWGAIKSKACISKTTSDSAKGTTHSWHPDERSRREQKQAL